MLFINIVYVSEILRKLHAVLWQCLISWNVEVGTLLKREDLSYSFNFVTAFFDSERKTIAVVDVIFGINAVCLQDSNALSHSLFSHSEFRYSVTI